MVDTHSLTSMDGLHEEGFEGFMTVADLRLQGRATIPESPGVYLFLRDGPSPPDFLEIGTGGHFKNKDPNVPIARLQDEWVTDARIVYIGQSGSGSSGTLKNRIRQMLRFGRGARVGHWGGRLVWKLRDVEQLQVCWKEAPTGDPKVFETESIRTFKSLYGGKRPFANLQG